MDTNLPWPDRGCSPAESQLNKNMALLNWPIIHKSKNFLLLWIVPVCARFTAPAHPIYAELIKPRVHDPRTAILKTTTGCHPNSRRREQTRPCRSAMMHFKSVAVNQSRWTMVWSLTLYWTLVRLCVGIASWKIPQYSYDAWYWISQQFPAKYQGIYSSNRKSIYFCWTLNAK